MDAQRSGDPAMNTAFAVEAPHQVGKLSRLLVSIYVLDLVLAAGAGTLLLFRYALLGMGLLFLAVVVPILLFLAALLGAGLLLVIASATVFIRPRTRAS
jgi:hypothetical protein